MNTADEVLQAVGLVWLRRTIRNGGCPFCFAIDGGKWITAHKEGCKVGILLDEITELERKLKEVGARDPTNEAWD